MTAALAYPQDWASAVVSDPEWLPLHFDRSGFLALTRLSLEQRRSLPFLRPDCFSDDLEHTTISAAAAQFALATSPTVALHFIFHTAFCGSTLLSNAIDALPGCIAFKEPAIFTHLAQRQASGEDFNRTGQLDLTLQLFARGFGEVRAAVVKPACFANPLIPTIMQLHQESRAILLFSDVRSFLLSVAKRGLSGDKWTRQAFAAALRHHPLPLNFSVTDLLGFTDLQVAALTWLMRTAFLQRMHLELGPERCRLIDGAAIRDRPMDVISGSAEFFALGVPPEELANLANSDVLRRHSKDGRGYDAAQREADFRAALSRHGKEVEAVASWIEQIAAENGTRSFIAGDQIKSWSSSQ